MLVDDPAAGLLVPRAGDGLYVVLAGAALLALAVFASVAVPRVRPLLLAPTASALLALAAVALLVPGLYGEYYLHIARGHAAGHTDALQSAHTLTAVGIVAAIAALQALVVSMGRPSPAVLR